MQLIHENKLIRLWYDAEHKILWFKFVGLFNSGLLEENYKVAMTYGETHEVKGMYYDLSQMKGTFTKSLGYIKNTFVPKMEENGALYTSFAMNDGDVFMKFAMNQMFKILATKIELKAHKNNEQALAWLSEKMGTELSLPSELDRVAV